MLKVSLVSTDIKMKVTMHWSLWRAAGKNSSKRKWGGKKSAENYEWVNGSSDELLWFIIIFTKSSHYCLFCVFLCFTLPLIVWLACDWQCWRTRSRKDENLKRCRGKMLRGENDCDCFRWNKTLLSLYAEDQRIWRSLMTPVFVSASAYAWASRKMKRTCAWRRRRWKEN